MNTISVGGQMVWVEDLSPWRKRKALMLSDTVGQARVLAYFRNDDCAEAMRFWLDRLALSIDPKAYEKAENGGK